MTKIPIYVPPVLSTDEKSEVKFEFNIEDEGVGMGTGSFFFVRRNFVSLELLLLSLSQHRLKQFTTDNG